MTDAPAELLRQLHEDERVLWHARPRFLRLKQQLCQLLVTGLLAWFIAFLGRHSHGCMVETVMFRDADGVPHTITLRCRNGEDTRYFTPGASLPLVYRPNTRKKPNSPSPGSNITNASGPSSGFRSRRYVRGRYSYGAVPARH